MSKEQPIFSRQDTPSNLPPELQGKSPEEIAAYFMRREQIYENRLRQQQRVAPPSPPAEEKKDDDKFDMFGDPKGSVQREVNRQVQEQIGRIQQIAQPSLINSNRNTVASRYPDYGRFAKEIESRMAQMNVESQMNPDFWDFTYRLVKGEMTDVLVREGEERGRKSMMPIEMPTPSGGEAPAPRELDPIERTFAKRFDMTEEQWREAADRFDSTGGKLPVTMDTRLKPKKKEKSSNG